MAPASPQLYFTLEFRLDFASGGSQWGWLKLAVLTLHKVNHVPPTVYNFVRNVPVSQVPYPTGYGVDDDCDVLFGCPLEGRVEN
jgi:hypothetical protein